MKTKIDVKNDALSEIKYRDRQLGILVDRCEKESEVEPIDVLMLTLDAASFLERCLYSVYREIPVRRLLVCDGGSKDATIEILKKYPRVQLFIRPDVRTTGKAFEFLFSHVETEWFVLIDADIELSPGWYDEMCKYKAEYDFLECSRRILAYHFYREDPGKLNINARAYDFCHLGRKEAIKKYRCDDDFIWRMVDFYLRQQIEKSGYRYGKVPSTCHLHHETERIPYESDEEKRFHKVVFKEPQWIIIDREKWKRSMQKYAKGIVKYLNPEHPLIKKDLGFDKVITMLDRDWIARNGPAWLKRYDEATSLKTRLRALLRARLPRRIISLLRKKFRG